MHKTPVHTDQILTLNSISGELFLTRLEVTSSSLKRSTGSLNFSSCNDGVNRKRFRCRISTLETGNKNKKTYELVPEDCCLISHEEFWLSIKWLHISALVQIWWISHWAWSFIADFSNESALKLHSHGTKSNQDLILTQVKEVIPQIDVHITWNGNKWLPGTVENKCF